MQHYHAPDAPWTILLSPQEGDRLLSSGKQKEYHSGVGMLGYLVKHSQPDLSNIVRELSKNMDGATEYQFKEMLRAVKNVLDTKYHALLIYPKEDYIDNKTVV